MKNLLALSIFTCLYACSQTASTPSPAVKKSTQDSQPATSDEVTLTLTWTTLPEMSGYHIFYVDAKKKTREIDAVLQGDEAFEEGKIIVDSNNMETWPKSGEKACFYVVADLEGVKSDPSSQACVTL